MSPGLNEPDLFVADMREWVRGAEDAVRDWIGIGAGFLLAGCGAPVMDRAVDGPYRLRATDAPDERVICYGVDPCETRVPAKVWAVGYDSRYVVAEQRALGKGGEMSDDSSYYYIERAKDGPLVDPSVSVHGPFDLANYGREKERLGLPELRKIDHIRPAHIF